MSTESTEPTGDGPVRVVVVDDDRIVRTTLRLIIDGEPDLTVVGEAADGDAAPEVIARPRPDVVLMDVRMPRRDGLSATEEVLATARPPRVLVLTTFDSDATVLTALRLGAAGFVLKDTPPPRLLAAVRAVAAGEPALSPSVAARLIAAATRPGSADAGRRARTEARERLSVLTDRERHVAAGIADGLSNDEIGRRLHVSVATVKSHTGSLFTKLGLANRVQIALLVRDAGDDPATGLPPR